MRLLERIHLVGSGWLGFSLSDRHDSHIYLVDGGSASVVVDAGSGLATDVVVDAVRAAGAGPVSHVLVTHGHADHAAGAGALATALGAAVGASAPVARMLVDADEEATGLAVARAVGTYPADLRLRPTAVDVVLDREPLLVGDLTLTPVPTPGHADGHLCFLVEAGPDRALFTGDLVFARGRVAVLGTADTDLAALRDSIGVAAATAPTALLPGHGSPALTGAGEHLEHARRCFALGQLPPGLLP